MTLKAGRIYSGLPYSYAGGMIDRFMLYSGKKNKDGIPVISNLSWQSLSGGTHLSRMGNDCCGVIVNAWASIGAYLPAESPLLQYSTEDFGFLRVGDYTSPSDKFIETKDDIKRNGEEVIYKAYAKLFPADAVVKYSTSGGHMRMITSLEVVYKEDGSIDGEKSTMTMIEQTSTQFRKEATYYDETLGCDVYKIGNECTFSFYDMWKTGYLPITCKVLRDPSPIPEPKLIDSEKRFDVTTIYVGDIISDLLMDYFTYTISDSEGKTVQEATAFVRRNNGIYSYQRKFELCQFFIGDPENIIGKIDYRALPAGTYRITLVCTLMNGDEIPVRDYEFTK